jgi:hypothetical protein
MRDIVSRNRTRVVVWSLILAVAALSPAIAQHPQANPEGGGSRRHIEGVWIWQLQGQDCVNGTPMGPQSPGLVTFAAGGTLSETTTIPQQANPTPFFRSPGHGTWERYNWEHYAAAFVLQRLNADGTFAGRTVLRGEIQLTDGGNGFVWSGRGEFMAPNGTVILTTCNSATGVRFE